MAAVWQDDDPFSECAHCESDFEHEVSYPVVTREGDDQEFELHSFCNEECKRAWLHGAYLSR